MKSYLRYLLIVVSVGLFNQLVAQKHDEVLPLTLRWTLHENKFRNDWANLSSYTLTNKGKETFPASGWTLYFNYYRMIVPDHTTAGYTLTHLNGDLFQLRPATGNLPLKPGDSLQITFVSEGLVWNSAIAPCGFYLVFDQFPEKAYALQNTMIDEISDKSTQFVSPESTYSDNSFITDLSLSELPPVFPTPASCKVFPGHFIFSKNIQIIADQMFTQEKILLEDLLLQWNAKAFDPKGKAMQKIIFKKENIADEAYGIEIQNEMILLRAGSTSGMFYALQSLKSAVQKVNPEKKNPTYSLACMRVEDKPRFVHRGLMIDVARNFQPKESLLKLIDLMSMYKLNTLHLHFSDDEGWRIEIKDLPELTQIGAKRGFTGGSNSCLPPSFGSGPSINQPFASGYYSRDEFIEILKFAKARHVRVIPEVESPGHSRAAIKSMEARYKSYLASGNREEAEKYLLTDFNDKSNHLSAQLWKDNIMCVAMPGTYRFIAKVTDELIAMYHEADAPLNTIHLGGDEVPNGTWEKSPACQQFIDKQSNIQTAHDLWYYYFNRVDSMMKQRGLYVSGWEEIAMLKTKRQGKNCYLPNPAFADRNFHVNVWNNGIGWGDEDLPYRLANAGYEVVLSCVSNLYFDLSYEKSPFEPGLYWGGFNDIDNIFSFVPFDYYQTISENTQGELVDQSIFACRERLTEYGQTHIPGIQAQLFGETLRTPDRLEYMLYPKMFALAERAWSPDPEWVVKDKVNTDSVYNHAWSVFVNTLGKKELPRLDQYKGGVAYRIPPVGATVADGKVMTNLQIPGLSIRYTPDGTEPTMKSAVYLKPIEAKGTIRLAAFSANGRRGRSIQIINP